MCADVEPLPSVGNMLCNTLVSHTARYSTNAGRVYRPREGDRLVLFLKDINLPRPDKYDTCLLVAFLQQLVTFNGFYDENLEFLGIERVHIVATMNPATTVGRHHLSTRFTAIVRIAYMDYPTPQELGIIYSCYLRVRRVHVWLWLCGCGCGCMDVDVWMWLCGCL